MRGYLKNHPGLSACRERGNGRKQGAWQYSRLGAGAKGRRYQGNSARIPTCCPCHPPVKDSYARRVACREAATRSAALHRRQAQHNAPRA